MLTCIPELLAAETVDRFRDEMSAAEWTNGAASAETNPSSITANWHLPSSSDLAISLGQDLLNAIRQNPMYLSAALPLKICSPQFSRCGTGSSGGLLFDNALQVEASTGARIRADVTCAVFLSEPDEYDGGELQVEDQYSSRDVKLEAGDAVLYPSSNQHRLAEITRGERFAAFFSMQSVVRNHSHRSLLFELDQTIQEIAAERGANNSSCVSLTGIYQNLLRTWAET